MSKPRRTIEVHAKWRHPSGAVRRKVIHAELTDQVRDGKRVYRLHAPAPKRRVLSLRAKLPDGAVCAVVWPAS
jgi:hypothetical protein